MTLEAVEKVIQDDVLMQMFEIPKVLWPVVRKSWKECKMDMLGRMDLAWDGVGDPKLLEQNGDTPSVLVESGKVQFNWLMDKVGKNRLDGSNQMRMVSNEPQGKFIPQGSDQCNFIDAAIIDAFKNSKLGIFDNNQLLK